MTIVRTLIATGHEDGLGEELRHQFIFRCVVMTSVAVLVPVELYATRSLHIAGFSAVLDAWPSLLLLSVCLVYCRWSRFPRLIACTELAISTVVLTALLSVLIQIAGRSPRPLVDQQLSRLDTLMCFHTASIVQALSSYPALRMGLGVTYISLPLLMMTAVLLPPVIGKADESRRFIMAVIFASLATTILFYLWPAVGPWTVQPISPAADQLAISRYLGLLRSGLPVMLEMEHAGIVSFPSFHVVLAILSALTLGTIRRLRPFVWGLALFICLSTITTGWHYCVDVAGGVVIAIVSYSLAGMPWLVRRRLSSVGALGELHLVIPQLAQEDAA